MSYGYSINTCIYIEDGDEEHEIDAFVEYDYSPAVPATHWDPPEGTYIEITNIEPEQKLIVPKPSDLLQGKKPIDVTNYIEENWNTITDNLEQECIDMAEDR